MLMSVGGGKRSSRSFRFRNLGDDRLLIEGREEFAARSIHCPNLPAHPIALSLSWSKGLGFLPLQ